jgi:hemolysin III
MTEIDYKKELANALTHGLGIVFFLVAIPILAASAALKASISEMIAIGTYGFSLLMVYFSSTIYHTIQAPHTKHVLRIFDHASIYLLIGGSCTPIAAKFMQAPDAKVFFWAFWSLIAVGIIIKIFYTGKFRVFSALIYVALSWIAFWVLSPLAVNFSSFTLWMLGIGGLSYTIGVVFYIWKKLMYHHAIWHLFVLGGSLAHYLAIFDAFRN